jgi:hypothetical protein
MPRPSIPRSPTLLLFCAGLCLGCGAAPAGGPDGQTDPCAAPQAPRLEIIHAGAELVFSAADGMPVEVGSSRDPRAAAPDAWTAADRLVLPAVDEPTAVRVFARVAAAGCAGAECFAHRYQVRPAYPPPAGQPGSRALAADDPAIVGWAGAVERVDFGAEVSEPWRDSDQALGPAEGTASACVSLGRGGSLELGFDPPIADGPGPDLAVFENGFSDDFLELAVVEVSSDGEHYLRFAHAFLGEEPLAAFDRLDTRLVGGLAGKYRRGFGTPFDLAVFADAPEVRQGLVDLQAIRRVRILDVVGDGSRVDSFGHPIYDPYPTTDSAGFDLDAIAVLHAGQD